MNFFRVVVMVTLTLVGVGAAQSPSESGGLYTVDQAERGAALYEQQCVECHGELGQLTPDMAALLADHTFRARWSERSIGELFEMIQIEMPQDAPGSLSSQQTADVVAFILRGNRRPAGEASLPDDVEKLRSMPFERAQ